MTRPSGSVAASGASPSEPGAEQPGEALVRKNLANLVGDLRPLRRHRQRPQTSPARQARAHAGRAGAHRQDVRAAGGSASLACSAARDRSRRRRRRFASSVSCEGASGRGGRGSAGAAERAHSGTSARDWRPRGRLRPSRRRADRPAIAASPRPSARPADRRRRGSSAPAQRACASCSPRSPRLGLMPATTSRSLARVMAT